MSFRQCIRIVLSLVVMVVNFPRVESTVSYKEKNFESVPARFGMEWQPPNRTYQAHLQYLPDHPLLCVGEAEDVLEEVVTPNDTLPVALLVERGNCTFEEKAWVAMQAYPAISFLVIYDNIPEMNLVSMREFSDAEAIKLGMVFVSHEAGMGRFCYYCSLAVHLDLALTHRHRRID